MDYSIYKSSDPKTTVERIKKILKDLDIVLQEKIVNHSEPEKKIPYSLTVFLSDSEKIYKAEGKGSSLINAKASAYGEFIERFQNGFIFFERVSDFVFSPDEHFIEKEIYNKNFDDGLDYEIYWRINHLVNTKRKNMPLQNIEKVLVAPFYGVKEKNVVEIPVLVYEWLVGSNGMASGNTIEEALVQSLSEICERFVLKQVLENNIIMPDIPSVEYLKYSKIREMIKAFEESGYNIQIKDASLGIGIPVVSTIVYDSNQNIYTLMFGAHPSLPVAIERCLTEYAQGIDISCKNNYKTNICLKFQNSSKDTFGEKGNFSIDEKKVSETDLIYNVQQVEKEVYEYLCKANKMKFLFEKQFLHRVDIENNEFIQNKVLRKDSKYLYNRNNWIDNTQNVDNKFLLDFIIRKIQNYTSEIYIRDVSYLGFPSVRVYIPKMSLIFDYDVDRIELTEKWLRWLKTEFKNEKESIVHLYEAIKINLDTEFHLDSQLSDLPIEYILFLCSVYLCDTEKVLLYAKTIIENNKKCKFFKDSFIIRVNIIKDFYQKKAEKKSISEIFKYLDLLYQSEDIKKFKIFMRYLSPTVIKMLLTASSTKRNSDVQNEPNKQNIDNIIVNLVKKQKENIIDQAYLIKIFNQL